MSVPSGSTRGSYGTPKARRLAANWAEAVKAEAERERHANDPAAEALRLEWGRRLSRLAGAMRNEP